MTFHEARSIIYEIVTKYPGPNYNFIKRTGLSRHKIKESLRYLIRNGYIVKQDDKLIPQRIYRK